MAGLFLFISAMFCLILFGGALLLFQLIDKIVIETIFGFMVYGILLGALIMILSFFIKFIDKQKENLK